MKKALALGTAVMAPMALCCLAVVPNVVFLVTVLLLTPLFLDAALILGGTALLSTALIGFLVGHNAATTLIQSFIVGL